MKKTTVGIYLRACRVIWNACEKYGYVSRDDYPFGKDEDKVSIPKGATRRECYLDVDQMGVKASVDGDEMVIEGHSLAQRLLGGSPIKPGVTGEGVSLMNPEMTEVETRLLRGGSYTSHHDHRMVMALKVAALGADSPITIDDEDCVAKSFPQFHETFNSILLGTQSPDIQ